MIENTINFYSKYYIKISGSDIFSPKSNERNDKTPKKELETVIYFTCLVDG